MNTKGKIDTIYILEKRINYLRIACKTNVLHNSIIICHVENLEEGQEI